MWQSAIGAPETLGDDYDEQLGFLPLSFLPMATNIGFRLFGGAFGRRKKRQPPPPAWTPQVIKGQWEYLRNNAGDVTSAVRTIRVQKLRPGLVGAHPDVQRAVMNYHTTPKRYAVTKQHATVNADGTWTLAGEDGNEDDGLGVYRIRMVRRGVYRLNRRNAQARYWRPRMARARFSSFNAMSRPSRFGRANTKFIGTPGGGYGWGYRSSDAPQGVRMMGRPIRYGLMGDEGDNIDYAAVMRSYGLLGDCPDDLGNLGGISDFFKDAFGFVKDTVIPTVVSSLPIVGDIWKLFQGSKAQTVDLPPPLPAPPPLPTPAPTPAPAPGSGTAPPQPYQGGIPYGQMPWWMKSGALPPSLAAPLQSPLPPGSVFFPSGGGGAAAMMPQYETLPAPRESSSGGGGISISPMMLMAGGLGLAAVLMLSRK